MAIPRAIGADLYCGQTVHKPSTVAACFAPPPLRDFICSAFKIGPKMGSGWDPGAVQDRTARIIGYLCHDGAGAAGTLAEHCRRWPLGVQELSR